MTTQYVNKATYNGTTTVYWVTSGAADSTGVYSGYNTSLLTSIAVDYTYTGTTAGTSATTVSNVWQTALEIDFTAQPTQTLGTDGSVSFAGYTWTKINSANERSATVNTLGTGLVWSPGSTGDLYQSTRTMPGLTLNLASVIPNFSLDTPLRVWLYESTSNESQNYDSCVIAVERPASNTNYVLKRSYAGGTVQNCSANFNGSNQGQTNSTGVYSNNVIVVEMSQGVSALRARHLVGTYSNGFPGYSSLTSVGNLNAETGMNDVQWLGKAADWDLLIGSHRAGSGNNSYTATIARIKIEYLSTQAVGSPTINYGLYSSRPTSAPTGSVYNPSDGPVSYVYTGTAWAPIISGNVSGNEVAPSNTSPFSTVNGSSNATITVQGGCISMASITNNSSTQNIQGQEVAYTPTSGQSITGWFQMFGGNTCAAGIYVRESSTGKLLPYGIDFNGPSNSQQNLFVGRYTNFTTYSGSNSFNDTIFGGIKQPFGLRISYNGTNYSYQYSIDGITWVTFGSESATAYLSTGGNKAGFWLNPYSQNGSITCLSWKIG